MFRKIVLCLSFLLLVVMPPALIAQEDVDDLIDDGMALIDERAYPAAIIVFEEAVELDDDNAMAYLGLGVATYFNGDYEDGKAFVEQARELDPNNAEILANLANMVRFIDQDFDLATELIDEAIEIDPDLALAHYYRGRIFQLQSDFEIAIESFERAVELDDTYLNAWNQLGYANRSIREYDDAIDAFTQAIEIDADYASAWRGRGAVYRSLGELDLALDDLTMAIELDDGNAFAYALRGAVYRILGEFDLAIDDLTVAIELDDDYTFAYGTRGATYRSLGELELAIDDLTMAIELDDNYAFALAQRGIAYRSSGDYSLAIADLSDALEIDPDYGFALRGRGETYRLMGDYERAVDDFTESLEIDPDSDFALASRGESYRLLSNYNLAIDDLTAALEIDPNYEFALGSRGATYHSLGEYDKAIADFTDAIAIDPDNNFTLRGRGAAYVEIGEYELALDDLDAALDLFPDSSWGLAYRGYAHLRLGYYRESVADFEEALELDPNYQWAEDGRNLAIQGFVIAYGGQFLVEDISDELPSAADFTTRGIEYWEDGDWNYALRDFIQALELDPSNDTYFDNTYNLIGDIFMVSWSDLPAIWVGGVDQTGRDVTIPDEYDLAHPFSACGDLYINGITGSVTIFNADMGGEGDASATMQSALTIHRSEEEAMETYLAVVDYIDRCPNPQDGFRANRTSQDVIVGMQSTTYQAAIPVSNLFGDLFGFDLTTTGGIVIWVQGNFVGATLYAENGTFRFGWEIVDATVQFAQANNQKLVGQFSPLLQE